MKSYIACLAALVLATGCATKPPLVGRSDLTVVEGTELPPPTPSRATGEYVIRPLDKLKVAVVSIENVDQEVQVDASGRMSLPQTGVIQAAGRTLGELAEDISEGLRRAHFRDPKVAVNVYDAVEFTVSVDGEVREPGLYPVSERMTLMRAVASASGVTELAQQRHVVLFRTVNGQDMAALYDLGAIRRGLYKDPKVYANDVVVVGTSQAKRIFREAMQSSGLLVTPILALIQSR